jgi:chorismate mutase
MDAAGGDQLSLAAVRDALVRLEDSVVFALIERARHPRNAPAYAPAATAGEHSLVEFFVREAEALNAKASLFLFRAFLVRPSVSSVIKTCIALPG